MDILEFSSPFDLADTITTLLGNVDDDYPVISVYGKYDVIKELLEDLIMSGTFIANEIELQDYDVAHYDKEFVLYLTLNGVNVEKICCNGKYYSGSADITFIHEDCNSKLLKYIDSKTIYEFRYSDCDGECEYDEEECFIVNGKPTTKEEFNKFLNRIDEKYRDYMREMFFTYRCLKDEMKIFNDVCRLVSIFNQSL